MIDSDILALLSSGMEQERRRGLAEARARGVDISAVTDWVEVAFDLLDGVFWACEGMQARLEDSGTLTRDDILAITLGRCGHDLVEPIVRASEFVVVRWREGEPVSAPFSDHATFSDAIKAASKFFGDGIDVLYSPEDDDGLVPDIEELVSISAEQCAERLEELYDVAVGITEGMGSAVWDPGVLMFEQFEELHRRQESSGYRFLVAEYHEPESKPDALPFGAAVYCR